MTAKCTPNICTDNIEGTYRNVRLGRMEARAFIAILQAESWPGSRPPINIELIRWIIADFPPLPEGFEDSNYRFDGRGGLYLWDKNFNSSLKRALRNLVRKGAITKHHDPDPVMRNIKYTYRSNPEWRAARKQTLKKLKEAPGANSQQGDTK